MVKRNLSLDIMKGILVCFMVMAHIVQYFPINNITNSFSDYVNLTTFSGFMFANGYVCYIAYIEKELEKKVFVYKLLIGFLRTLLAFYISGISFSILVARNISYDTLWNILCFKYVPGHSEFLLSFAFVYPMLFIIGVLLRRMNRNICVIAIIVSLLATFIKYELVQSNIIGIFIGTYMFACFPLLQYGGYFFWGLTWRIKK